ncbi:hypothetical protein M9458_051961 [Cirrhinus mrigala]|uniref:Integrase zinc-binding domain-containing protein n=1 Tax=Cirrhinus mrigala TaxID=683832 RepID=A0ABD0MVW7_CIRMR
MLQWIRSPAHKWKQFVSNRVSEIQSLTNPAMWSHCKSKDNPADLPTRSQTVANLKESELWWKGPPFLTTPNLTEESDDDQSDEDVSNKLKQVQQITVQLNSSSDQSETEPVLDLLKYSKLKKKRTVRGSFIQTMPDLFPEEDCASIIYSDNARTFKRANQDLSELWQAIKDPQLLEYFSGKGIIWRFIVERAAWWSGFWERLVRNVYAPHRSRSTLNSRPLTFVHNEVDEPQSLTPAHFLVGEQLTSLLPKPFPADHNHHTVSKEKMTRSPQKPTELKTGDIVLIGDANRPRQTCKLGKIEELRILCCSHIHGDCVKKTSSRISLLVLEKANVDMVLGCPWLTKHDPIINWSSRCYQECLKELPKPVIATTHLSVCSTSVESPNSSQTLFIPPEYQDVFNKVTATHLPRYRPWGCAIDLLPGARLPKGRVYPLSIPERATMEEYIQEAFFFVAKKDGGLRPCIDYRALNEHTVKFAWSSDGPDKGGCGAELTTPYYHQGDSQTAPPGGPEGKIFVPTSLRHALLDSVHTSPGSGHPGSYRTLSLLKNRYRMFGLRHHLNTLSHLGINFVTDLAPSNGYTTIFVVVDQFSKACKLIPRCRGLISTSLCQLVVGIPSSAEWPDRTKIQDIGQYLPAYCHEHQDTWSQFLPWAEYAQNSLQQDTTGLTPFQCVLGFQPPMFPWSRELSEVPAVDYWFQESKRVWDSAHVQLQQAVRRHKDNADARRSDNPIYRPGDHGCPPGTSASNCQ